MSKIILKVSKDEEEIGYLYLPKHPKKVVYGIVKKLFQLRNLSKITKEFL